MSTFGRLLAASAMPGLLDLYGQPLRYRPAGGGAWQDLVGVIEIQEEPPSEERYEERARQRLTLTCLADPAGRFGGIAAPAEGDCLLVAGEPEDQPWTYQGQSATADGQSWRLVFARNRPIRYGR